MSSWKRCVTLRRLAVAALFLMPGLAGAQTAGIKSNVWKAVVRIDAMVSNKVVRSGTGFVLSKEIRRAHGTQRVRFLVTNKAMLGGWYSGEPELSSCFTRLEMHYHGINGPESQGIIFARTNCPLEGDIIVHDKADVGIVPLLFLDLTPEAIMPHLDISHLASITNFAPIQIGAKVVALGYPLGVKTINNNFPIIDSGHIASMPGSQLDLVIQTAKRSGASVEGRLRGKIYLIDGVSPETSGGPVVLSAEASRQDGDKEVLGIMSLSTAGNFAVCYSADYIIELVNEFDQTIKDFGENGSIILK
jgi:hypothetical protein